MKKHNSTAAWGLEYHWGGVAFYAEAPTPEGKKLAQETADMIVDMRAIRVRIVKDSEWRRIQKILRATLREDAGQ